MVGKGMSKDNNLDKRSLRNLFNFFLAILSYFHLVVSNSFQDALTGVVIAFENLVICLTLVFVFGK